MPLHGFLDGRSAPDHCAILRCLPSLPLTGLLSLRLTTTFGADLGGAWHNLKRLVPVVGRDVHHWLTNLLVFALRSLLKVRLLHLLGHGVMVQVGALAKAERILNDVWLDGR